MKQRWIAVSLAGAVALCAAPLVAQQAKLKVLKAVSFKPVEPDTPKMTPLSAKQIDALSKQALNKKDGSASRIVRLTVAHPRQGEHRLSFSKAQYVDGTRNDGVAMFQASAGGFAILNLTVEKDAFYLLSCSVSGASTWTSAGSTSGSIEVTGGNLVFGFKAEQSQAGILLGPAPDQSGSLSACELYKASSSISQSGAVH